MKNIYLAKKNLKAEHKKCLEKLNDLKNKKIALIACDYDGTILDRDDPVYNNPLKVVELAHQVVKKRIQFAFVSGRNTTLELPLRKLIPQFCQKKKINLTIWRSGGNGMNLYRITYSPDPKKIKVEEIYSKSLSFNEIKLILKVYKRMNIKPDNKAQAFFWNFLAKDLPEDLVPPKFLNLSRQLEGLLLAEKVKLTFVLPTAPIEQAKYINIFRRNLESHGFTVGWGRIPFADVTKKLLYYGKEIDGKKLMLNAIKKKLKIKNEQIVTFGDAPNDNNAGLLSFPYSFTNDFRVKKNDLNSPPFILKVSKSPIASVYKTIRYLIN